MEAEKWLIAEYYDSLKHLSPEGFTALTRILKEECTFFPTIRECLERTRPKGPFDFQTNCLRGPENFVSGVDPARRLPPPSTRLLTGSDGA